MKNRIHKSLGHLLEDKGTGTKISIYVPIRGDVPAHVLFTSLRESAVKLLPDTQTANSFRRWLRTIFESHRNYKNARTLACFYSNSVREVIILDQEVPSRVVVAQSWHVKPLMYVADSRPWGHLIEFNNHGISVIRSDGETHELMETIIPLVRSAMPSAFWHEELDRESLKALIARAANRIPEGTLVQINGAPAGFPQSLKFWQLFWTNVYVDGSKLGSTTREQNLNAFSQKLADQRLGALNIDISKEMDGIPVFSDPAIIARRILEGKIVRLFISLEAIQWGEMDTASGSIKHSKFQKDHLDEDVLDDIAELALRFGIEVRILRQSSFPDDLEILAA